MDKKHWAEKQVKYMDKRARMGMNVYFENIIMTNRLFAANGHMVQKKP